jgi:hypothetical protein
MKPGTSEFELRNFHLHFELYVVPVSLTSVIDD